ncbi:NADPH-dependent FMN reductase [Aureimonas ureilytica]|uniref:NADPH-dependent FMN reductase n=1 Tax=Aureimonas ureilytica TaxID=401562 RepID=UPI003CF99BCA
MIPRLLVLSGSPRPDVPESRLAAEATRLLAATEVSLTSASLADYPLPLFDGAADALPQNAWLLAQRLALQDGLLLVTGEHNGGMPAALKNAIDWIAHAAARENRPLSPFRRLVVALASACPSGGRQSLAQLRAVFAHLGAEAMTAEFHLNEAGGTIGPDGALARPEDQDRLSDFLDRALDHVGALSRQV